MVQDGVDGCDDGNQVNTDACLNSCQIAVCGDGIVQDGVDACDDGNQVDTDACLNTCQIAACGDAGLCRVQVAVDEVEIDPEIALVGAAFFTAATGLETKKAAVTRPPPA